MQTSEAPAIIHAAPLSTQTILQIQQDIKRTGAVEPIGRLMTVILDPTTAGEVVPDPDTDVWGRSLEFAETGPMLALSKDHFNLIIIGKFPLALPDTPRVSDPTQRVTQRYADRSNKHFQGTDYVVFEPIRQILADPITVQIPGSAGAPPPIIVSFKADSFGQYPALLIHEQNGEGFIVGGAWDFSGM